MFLLKSFCDLCIIIVTKINLTDIYNAVMV